eukprot:CAMPEP_0185164186 /NCGR_PEP_ID=MMETSP1139-20130426/9013_1 /TAXON_ID=298111 /ORGANISM="Pavlova sp., Strain CCMP459" /LENGTH=498 /DNA_ID=CAMNT_0027729555 /DNA_START=44 /DNA_END=1540 /DNA_ORIENTATION=+
MQGSRSIAIISRTCGALLIVAGVVFVLLAHESAPRGEPSALTHNAPPLNHPMYVNQHWKVACDICRYDRCSDKVEECGTRYGLVDPQRTQVDYCLCECCRIQCGLPKDCPRIPWIVLNFTIQEQLPMVPLNKRRHKTMLSPSDELKLQEAVIKYADLIMTENADITYDEATRTVTASIEIPRQLFGVTTELVDSSMFDQGPSALQAALGSDFTLAATSVSVFPHGGTKCTVNTDCTYHSFCAMETGSDEGLCTWHMCETADDCIGGADLYACEDNRCVKNENQKCTEDWMCMQREHDGFCYLPDPTSKAHGRCVRQETCTSDTACGIQPMHQFVKGKCIDNKCLPSDCTDDDSVCGRPDVLVCAPKPGHFDDATGTLAQKECFKKCEATGSDLDPLCYTPCAEEGDDFTCEDGFNKHEYKCVQGACYPTYANICDSTADCADVPQMDTGTVGYACCADKNGDATYDDNGNKVGDPDGLCKGNYHAMLHPIHDMECHFK